MNAFPPPPPPPPPPPLPGGVPGGFPPAAATSTSGKAIAALVLSILGFLCCPIIFSTIGIILGKQAQTEIAGNPMLEGDGLAQVAVILSIVGLVLGVLVAVGYVVVLAMSA